MTMRFVIAAALVVLPFPARAQDGRHAEKVKIPETTVEFELVSISGGRCKIGSPESEPGRKADESPPREVELEPFWIGRHEVTWKEFDLFYMEKSIARIVDGITRPSTGKSYFGQASPPPPASLTEPARPVASLRWHSAMAYCEWLSKITGHYYRLPTEAEWEAACRAGSPNASPEGLGDHAWCKENSEERTQPTGQKKGNPLGLHDMLGNVWEYCLEPHTPPHFGPVLRGGAWNSPASDLRFSKRQTVREEWFKGDPQDPNSVWWLQGGFSQGFRVVRVPDGYGGREPHPYSEKIQISFAEPTGKNRYVKEQDEQFTRVSGKIANGGDRTLLEVELTVLPLDPKGRPQFLGVGSQDAVARAIYSKCYPVLVNSYTEGEHRKPLKPGESRAFEVDLPRSLDEDRFVVPGKFAARVSALRFAKEK